MLTHEQGILLLCACVVADPIHACWKLEAMLGRPLIDNDADRTALAAIRKTLPPLTLKEIVAFADEMPPNIPLMMPPGFLTKAEHVLAEYYKAREAAGHSHEGANHGQH